MSVRIDIDADLPELTAEEEDLIQRAERLGRGIIAERASDVDQGFRSVRDNLVVLAENGLSGLTVPREFGGHGAGHIVQMRVLEALAYGDGTTPFVIAQHYGTCTMLDHSDNESLRRAALPQMAHGTLLAGFGISHVRRAGAPVLAATSCDGGYRFDGTIPWMTGLGLFSHVVIAGTLLDGRDVSAWTPFEESAQLQAGVPMDLVAMNAAQTISATIQGLFVPADRVVSVATSPLRGRPSATPVPCLFGLTRASIDDLAAMAARRNAPASARAAVRLGERLEQQRSSFYRTVHEQGTEMTAVLIEARTAATTLALDAVAAQTVASGGGANARSHPAQRRLREVSVFATWGLSTEAVDAAVTALSTCEA